MLRVLTEQEELASRGEGFARLQPGTLFDLGGHRYFIATQKRGRTVEVVELDSANIGRILHGKPCARARLRFDDMSCLNLHVPGADPGSGAQTKVPPRTPPRAGGRRDRERARRTHRAS